MNNNEIICVEIFYKMCFVHNDHNETNQKKIENRIFFIQFIFVVIIILLNE